MVCTAAFHNGQYRKVSYIICTFVGNKIVDHSDVVGDLTVHVLPLSQWNLRLIVSYNTYRWLSARLMQLQCVSNGVTAALHWAIHIVWPLQVQDLEKTMNPQRTPHISPSRVSCTYGYMYFASIFGEKWPCCKGVWLCAICGLHRLTMQVLQSLHLHETKVDNPICFNTCKCDI